MHILPVVRSASYLPLSGWATGADFYQPQAILTPLFVDTATCEVGVDVLAHLKRSEQGFSGLS